tara:strand:- start:238 stop:804 length:567 start_codon:yes stop_codon:yes gene_type:complete
MSQLTIKVSAKGDAMIATLQKEIFNRRRKKVTAAQVVETLVESGAKSQSDKRYAASWKNLIKDIEKAAKVSEVHGNKPANISAEEWALIISHRSRKGTTAKRAGAKKPAAKKSAAKKPAAKEAVAKKQAAKKTTIKTSKVKSAVKKVASAQTKQASSTKSSVAKRMAKAVAGRPARRARKVRTKAVKA